MNSLKTQEKILIILLKEPFNIHTSTSLAKALNITRQGIWKILNNLEKDKLIVLEQISKTKTGTAIIKLNWQNPLLEKTLSLLLAKESINYQRWINNFAELENKVDFLIIYGSIINSPKEANDIDILGITNKKKFVKIEESIRKIQKTQEKKIHSLNFTQDEFKQELKNKNKAFINAVKKGVALFGHENFIKFISNLQK